VVSTTMRGAAQGIVVETTGLEQPVLVQGGDAESLRALLRNLADNAVVHGGAGLSVTLSLSTRGGGRREEAVVTVTDRGPGIDPAELARVFEPFERGRAALEEQRPGSGLGLAIAREAAERHGGRVGASSAPGRGCTFTVVLPLSRRGREPLARRGR
jgi:signal transduction histidine kinase